MSRFYYIIGVVVVLTLQVRLWSAEGGVPEMMDLQRQVDAATIRNEEVQASNLVLVAQADALKADEAVAIESRARQGLGMVKEGETFYLLVEPR